MQIIDLPYELQLFVLERVFDRVSVRKCLELYIGAYHLKDFAWKLSKNWLAKALQLRHYTLAGIVYSLIGGTIDRKTLLRLPRDEGIRFLQASYRRGKLVPCFDIFMFCQAQMSHMPQNLEFLCSIYFVHVVKSVSKGCTCKGIHANLDTLINFLRRFCKRGTWEELKHIQFVGNIDSLQEYIIWSANVPFSDLMAQYIVDLETRLTHKLSVQDAIHLLKSNDIGLQALEIAYQQKCLPDLPVDQWKPIGDKEVQWTLNYFPETVDLKNVLRNYASPAAVNMIFNRLPYLVSEVQEFIQTDTSDKYIMEREFLKDILRKLTI